MRSVALPGAVMLTVLDELSVLVLQEPDNRLAHSLLVLCTGILCFGDDYSDYYQVIACCEW
jgi:hypothetical protein